MRPARPSQGSFNSPYGTALEQIEWGLPSELQSQWLSAKEWSAAAWSPWPVGAVRVRFDGDQPLIEIRSERMRSTIVGSTVECQSTFAPGS